MKILPKLIKFCKKNQQDIVLTLAAGLIAVISFNVGRIYTAQNLKASLIVTGGSSQNLIEKRSDTQKPDLRVIISKNSTSKKYHFLWCPGAEKIKEENKIYFSSEAEAQSRGYALARNCSK